MPKRNDQQQELIPPEMDGLCCDWTGKTYAARLKAAAKFCAERHLIYLRRRAGQPAPWTKDPILRNYRFCNIYREIDRVTEEIMENWLVPQLNGNNPAIAALVGRVINFTPTLIAMRQAGITFREGSGQAKAWRLFQSIVAKKGKAGQLVTGAYIVNTVFPRDFPKITGTKADYLANFFLPEVWSHRVELDAALSKGSYIGMLDAYRKVHGVGMFIANQAACDLSYTSLLRKAKDINEVWSPGPGTMKGIRRITGNYDLQPGSEATNSALSRYAYDLNTELSKHKHFSSNTKDVKSKIVPLTNPNASNSLCELSKHWGMAMGERDRLKNTYRQGK
jgi:hypothetical protein